MGGGGGRGPGGSRGRGKGRGVNEIKIATKDFFNNVSVGRLVGVG